MRFFSGQSLAARLTWGFGTILVLLVAMAALSLVRMQELTSTLEEITVRNAERSRAVGLLAHGVSEYVQDLGDLAATDLARAAAVLTKIQSTLAAYDAAQSQLLVLMPKDERTQSLVQSINQKATEARQLIALAEKLSDGRGATAHVFHVRNEYVRDTAKWSASQQAWSKAVNDLSEWQRDINTALSAQATATAATTRVVIFGGALLAFALGCGIAVWLIRDTKSAINQAVQATQRMAQHDLSQPIETTRSDEIGGLLQALESMRLNLHELAQGVRLASDGIHSASGEIAQGSLDLSNRTEEAANTLQTSLESITKMSQSVNEISTSSRSANGLSTEASAVVNRGGEVMTQVVVTMGEIDVASRKIADITSIIDGIAFQTNILALNAAVEAARAGEQGRGFAVVASEVRALAGRSAEAAKEIKALITASLDKVASGSEQVALAGSTASEVTASVQRVSAIIAAIAAEAGQQGARIGDANQSMGQLDMLVHQNAALAEQSAAAASSLRQQSMELAELVSKFDLGADHRSNSFRTTSARLIQG